jgi:hypothetical protein
VALGGVSRRNPSRQGDSEGEVLIYVVWIQMWCVRFDEKIALPVSTMPLQVAWKSKNSLTGTAPAAYTTLPSLLDSVAGNVLMGLPTATVWPA